MNSQNINKDTYIEILKDKDLIDEDIVLIFKTITSLDKQEASATELSRIIGWNDKNSIIGKIVGSGKRIIKKYNIDLRKREDGTKVYWELFFDGYFKGKYFIYSVKPELMKALNETGVLRSDSVFSNQDSYLFIWNPKNWDWIHLEENIAELRKYGKIIIEWSCISHKSIRIGDRAFIAVVGQEPRGVFASGYVISEPFLSPHWEDKKKNIYRVSIELEILLNPMKEKILETVAFNSESMKKQTWTPQSSGIRIQKEAVMELEELWFNFVSSQSNMNEIKDKPEVGQYYEGKVTEVKHNTYERNPFARRKCLEYYGYKCKICNFDFEKTYGNVGYKFIHVHHITPISNIGKEILVDPIKDLIPICPNCHAMVHRSNPPISIEEMKEIVTENRAGSGN